MSRSLHGALGRPRTAGRRPHGQAIVELALALPVMLGLLLGGCELARFGAHVWTAQRAADTLADWSAGHGGDIASAAWSAVASDELSRADCDGTAAASLPDGTDPAGRVVVTVQCTYAAVFASGFATSYGAETSATLRPLASALP